MITFAYVVETAGIEALLYGTDAGRVDQAMKAVAKDIKPGQTGSRELVIGKAAVELSRLGSLEAPASTLAEVRRSLDEFLTKNDDKWAKWLKARAMIAAGERNEAKAVLKSAADGPDGLCVAILDQADLLVDEGKLEEAIPLFDNVLKQSKDHPLAVLGKAMALAESTIDPNTAIDNLSVKLDKNVGPRVAAYRNLALAIAKTNIEDYANATEALKKALAKPPVEPRFWTRVAWAQYVRGKFQEAAAARGKVAWYGKKDAQDDPSVKLVDAALSLASGEADKTLAIATKLEGIRPRLLRAYAELDQKNAKGALENLDWILEKAKDNLEAQILKEEAKMIQGPVPPAAEALEKLARKAKSKIGRHALGMGYYLAGNAASAQPQLEQAVAELNEEAPNPLAYRTYAALAEIQLAAGKIPEAGKALDESLKHNSGYFPSRVLQAKIVLRNGEPDRALNLLAPIRKEVSSADVDILTIEAVCTSKKTSEKQKDEAKNGLAALKDKGNNEELAHAAAACDPKLVGELGLSGAEKAAAKPDKKDRKHHH